MHNEYGSKVDSMRMWVGPRNNNQVVVSLTN
jgi:hypothetical protein